MHINIICIVIFLTCTAYAVSAENGKIQMNNDPSTGWIYRGPLLVDGLPKNFDARQKWPKCKSIGLIHNQGNCHSSYAISVVSAAADRICIGSNGTLTPVISPQQIISCCYLCGYGCRGGSAYESWDFYRRHGFVSGGDYGTNQGCQPYKIPPCKIQKEITTEDSCTLHKTDDTPQCETKCYNTQYKTEYKNDLYKGLPAYQVDPYIATKEIFENGPITASFYMYKHLLDYKSGVYSFDYNSSRHYFHRQTVKIIGWGEEKGTSYWLAANSLGYEWGNNGTFKIARDENGCFLEEEMYAAMPLL
ncbi:cathepsin B-like cysteine proteinase 3 [Adelges cooleyi]|uniref:cathepsin B-like cysteine proteinase 3 n=1 Tax=Adelges cooleyi TaxID=133065 RepID=UPI0021803B64|nr:cathepsin B-like cysteine proteinase 3 [Adelges cooleyi]